MKLNQTFLNSANMILALLLMILNATFAQAEPPEQINYQGNVLVNDVAYTGTGQLKFALVDEAGTISYWSNDGTSVGGSEPTAAVSLPVGNGLFSVNLGDTSLTNMTQALTASIVANNSPIYMNIWFNDGVNGFQLLSPSNEMVSVPYSLDAATLSGKTALSLDQSAHVTDMGNPHAVNSTQIGAATVADIVTHDKNASAHHAAPTSLPPSGKAGGDLTGNFLTQTLPLTQSVL